MADATAVYASRDAILYFADFNDTNDLPDSDTIDWGDAWGAPWDEAGYTQEGIQFSISVERATIEVDQELDPVLRPITGRDITISSNMAEFSAAKLRMATGQGAVTTVAAGSGTKGEVDYDFTSLVQDNYSSWGVDFRKNDDGEPIRVFIPRGLPIGSVETNMGDAENNLQIPFEVAALPDTSVTPARILTIREVLPALP